MKEVKRLENKFNEKVKDLNRSEDEFEMENKHLKERLEKMCRMNERQMKQIGQFCWDLEEVKKVVIAKDKEIEMFENRKVVTNKILKNLQSKKEDLTNVMKTKNVDNEIKQKEIDNLRSNIANKNSELNSRRH